MASHALRSTALILFISILSSCGFSRTGDGVLREGDVDFPEKNANPIRLIQLHGDVSTSLDIELRSIYEAGGKGCKYAPTFIAGALEGATFQLMAEAPIEVTRTMNKFSATTSFDHFKSGSCEWRLRRILATVSKGTQKSTWPRRIASTPDTKFQETWAANSGQIPTIVKCRFSRTVGGKAALDPCTLMGKDYVFAREAKEKQ